MTWINYSLPLIEKFLNYLFYREINQEHLQALHGKIHHFIMPEILNFAIHWNEKSLKLSHGNSCVPELTVIMPLQAMATFILTRNFKAAMNVGLKIEGDPTQGSRVENLFELNADKLESLMGDFLGQTLASKVINFCKHASEKKEYKMAQGFAMFSDYIQHEAEWVPSTFEIIEFNNDIDELRNDVERLSARIQSFIHPN